MHARKRTLSHLFEDDIERQQERSPSRLALGWLGVVMLSLGSLSYGPFAAVAMPSAASLHAAPAREADASANTPPKVISTINPEYTKEARSKKITGKCILSAVIDKDGTPQDITVVTSVADGVAPKLREVAATLDGQAVKALQQYRFRPAMKDGMPVASKIKILVNFQLF